MKDKQSFQRRIIESWHSGKTYTIDSELLMVRMPYVEVPIAYCEKQKQWIRELKMHVQKEYSDETNDKPVEMYYVLDDINGKCLDYPHAKHVILKSFASTVVWNTIKSEWYKQFAALECGQKYLITVNSDENITRLHWHMWGFDVLDKYNANNETTGVQEMNYLLFLSKPHCIQQAPPIELDFNDFKSSEAFALNQTLTRSWAKRMAINGNDEHIQCVVPVSVVEGDWLTHKPDVKHWYCNEVSLSKDKDWYQLDLSPRFKWASSSIDWMTEDFEEEANQKMAKWRRSDFCVLFFKNCKNLHKRNLNDIFRLYGTIMNLHHNRMAIMCAKTTLYVLNICVVL